MKGKLLFQGAEAKVYEGEWLGLPAIIKHRFPKKYRLPELDSSITKERMKNEARTIVRCRAVGIRAPCLYDVDFHTSELIMEKIEKSITVRNLIYKYVDENRCFDGEDRQENGFRCLSNFMNDLACKIGSVLSKLHKNNIVHGDLTTSNMLLVEPFETSDITLIDFGLSSMEEKAEDKAVDLYVLEKAILSTHPDTENFVFTLLREYETSGGRSASETIAKLDEVRLRGRKKLAFG